MTHEYSKALELSYLAWLAYSTELAEIHEKLNASESPNLQAYQILELLRDWTEHYQQFEIQKGSKAYRQK